MLTMLQPWMLSRMACYSASVPTPETADAFAKLVEARARLNEVTKQLNEAHISMHSSTDARQRYLDLQEAWKLAFKEFETATAELAAAVIRARQQIEPESK